MAASEKGQGAKAREVKPPQPVDDPLIELFRSNTTVSVAVMTGFLVIGRLIAVSQFKLETALALLNSAGVANVLIGSTISVLPPLVPIIGWFLVKLAVEYYRAGRRALASAYAAGLTLLLAVEVSPVLLIAAYALAYLSPFAGEWIVRRRGRTPVPRPAENALALLIYVGSLPIIFIATGNTMWLPAEAITANGHTVVGYVTQSDGEWTSILTDKPRTIVIYATNTISSRSICRIPSQSYSGTLQQILSPISPVPDCPTP